MMLNGIYALRDPEDWESQMKLLIENDDQPDNALLDELTSRIDNEVEQFDTLTEIETRIKRDGVSIEDIRQIENAVPNATAGLNYCDFTLRPSPVNLEAALNAIDWKKAGIIGIIATLIAAIIALIAKMRGKGKSDGNSSEQDVPSEHYKRKQEQADREHQKELQEWEKKRAALEQERAEAQKALDDAISQQSAEIKKKDKKMTKAEWLDQLNPRDFYKMASDEGLIKLWMFAESNELKSIFPNLFTVDSGGVRLKYRNDELFGTLFNAISNYGGKRDLALLANQNIQNTFHEELKKNIKYADGFTSDLSKKGAALDECFSALAHVISMEPTEEWIANTRTMKIMNRTDIGKWPQLIKVVNYWYDKSDELSLADVENHTTFGGIDGVLTKEISKEFDHSSFKFSNVRDVLNTVGLSAARHKNFFGGNASKSMAEYQARLDTFSKNSLKSIAKNTESINVFYSQLTAADLPNDIRETINKIRYLKNLQNGIMIASKKSLSSLSECNYVDQQIYNAVNSVNRLIDKLFQFQEDMDKIAKFLSNPPK